MAFFAIEETKCSYQQLVLDMYNSSSKDHSGGMGFSLRSKEECGLGVKDLIVLNKAMLKKLALRMMTENSMIFTYLFARYFIQDHKP